jgi:hypothetical protein
LWAFSSLQVGKRVGFFDQTVRSANLQALLEMLSPIIAAWRSAWLNAGLHI